MNYRAFDVVATSFDKGEVLVRSRRNGSTRFLSPMQAQLLSSCRRFKTLHEHAAQYCQLREKQKLESAPTTSIFGRLMSWTAGVASKENLDLPVRAREIEAVKQQLASLVDEGFLISEADLRARIQELCDRRDYARDAAGTITSIGLPTRNRPRSLERAIGSYLDNNRYYGRAVDYVVIDNSEREETRKKYRESLWELQERDGLSVFYADRKRRADFANRIAQYADAPSDVVRFALLGDSRCSDTYGACRNALMLHTAGEVCLQADDDTICKIAVPPDASEELSLTSRNDLDEFWFFRDRESALESAVFVDEDVLGIHERLLGRRLGAIISGMEFSPDLAGMNGASLHLEEISSRFLRNWRRTGARVTLSFMGTIGDSGMQSNQGRLFLKGNSYTRLIHTESEYRINLGARQLLKSPIGSCVSDGSYCMTINMGLDNRTLLPPFMPVQRNEDGVFGNILKVCFPEAYAGHLPYAVLHVPPEHRPNDPEAVFAGLRSLCLNDLIPRLLLSVDSESYCSPEATENLQKLGGFFKDIASLSTVDFKGIVRERITHTLGLQLREAKRHLAEKRRAPSYWVEDIKRYMAILRKAAMQDRFFVPSDLPGSAEERQAIFQELTCKFGELLIHWPAMVEAAKELRDSGQELAMRVQE